jgi:hypothetical protein
MDDSYLCLEKIRGCDLSIAISLQHVCHDEDSFRHSVRFKPSALIDVPLAGTEKVIEHKPFPVGPSWIIEFDF